MQGAEHSKLHIYVPLLPQGSRMRMCAAKLKPIGGENDAYLIPYTD